MTAALTLVVNPAAGGGKPASYLPRVTAVLDAAGASYTVSQSASLEHARTLAAAAARRGETVVAFGGDGLTGALAGAIAEVTEGSPGGAAGPAQQQAPQQAQQQTEQQATQQTQQQAEQQAGQVRTGPGAPGSPAGPARPACAFGIVPAGRGNDFARTLRVPFEPAAAARLLVDGRLQPVDLISVTGAEGGHAIVAGSVYVGIAAVAGEIANRARLVRGPAVYHVAALRALLGWRATTFRVETTRPDGARATSEFRGYAVVVANTPYFGAGMKVAPGALHTDGVLDIVAMRHAPKVAFVRVLLKIRHGSHVSLAQVSTDRAAAVTVTVDRPMPAGGDGELLAVRPPLRIRAMPAALNVIVPR
jgi:diacylglycerol kinase (ATP)